MHYGLRTTRALRACTCGNAKVMTYASQGSTKIPTSKTLTLHAARICLPGRPAHFAANALLVTSLLVLLRFRNLEKAVAIDLRTIDTWRMGELWRGYVRECRRWI